MESICNEVISYTSVAGEKQKELTYENVVQSTITVAKETAINGTITAVTGKAASKFVKINSGWFKPQKLMSSFFGKYAQKIWAQAAVQGGISLRSSTAKIPIVRQGR